MRHGVLRTGLVVLAVLSTLGSGGCGSGGDALPANDAARVGTTDITKAVLNHWMASTVASDFLEMSIKAPTGLVGDPPNYAQCGSAVVALTRDAARSKSSPPAALVKRVCVQLESGIRRQAAEYLILTQILYERAAEAGVRVSAQEVREEFKAVRQEQFPTEAALHTYLVDHQLSLSDEMAILKKDVLSTRLHIALQKKFGASGGEQALISYSHSSLLKWIAKTDCGPDYINEACRQYKNGAVHRAPPSLGVMVEELKAGQTSKH